MMDGTVLIADDDRTIRTVLTQALTRAGCRVHATGSLVTLKRWVEEGRGDLVISDVVMPDGNGLDALPEIAAMRPGLPVIVISAQNTIMTAIQAAEHEAFDYLPKPFDLPDLLRRAARALAQPRRAATPARAIPDEGEDLPLVGRAPAMQALYRLVARVMNTAMPVLITGESGTGKSLIARAIHDFSDRRGQPFVVANVDDLAPADGPARILARVGRGTLVLDGIGDFDEAAQARLARMLDVPGDPAPRVIATAPVDLSRRLRPGGFRDDLYYRLCGVAIAVPALRERLEDIPLLAEHFLSRAARDGLTPRTLSPDAAQGLRAYPWPGNLRQLENTMQRLTITGTDPLITRAEVETALGAPGAGPVLAVEADETLSASVARHLARYFALHGGSLPPPGVYHRVLNEVEVPLIEIALDATGGNQVRAAELLGLNRNTLRKKITEREIEVTRRRKLM
jgi:two-component system nitrogen regulation response regulator GlnG